MHTFINRAITLQNVIILTFNFQLMNRLRTDIGVPEFNRYIMILTVNYKKIRNMLPDNVPEVKN
jgi:hypothetical protein